VIFYQLDRPVAVKDETMIDKENEKFFEGNFVLLIPHSP
jgi:hypothetical protein